jgi:hypothetical protein
MRAILDQPSLAFAGRPTQGVDDSRFAQSQGVALGDLLALFDRSTG